MHARAAGPLYLGRPMSASSPPPSPLPHDREELARAISEGLKFAGLKESQRGMVERYLNEHPDDWMNCCGSSCDPCVLTIGHAVAKARQILGLPGF